MSYTPVEIRHVKLRRGLFGYRRRQVDPPARGDRPTSFETVWRERADHSDRVELLEGELKRYRELEALLRTTLVSAERAAHELQGPGQARGRRRSSPRPRPRRARSPARPAASARRCRRGPPAAPAPARRARRPRRGRRREQTQARRRAGGRAARRRPPEALPILGRDGRADDTSPAAGLARRCAHRARRPHGDAWKVRVSAAPERGRANDAVVGSSPSASASRATSPSFRRTARDKVVELRGLAPARPSDGWRSVVTIDTDRFRSSSRRSAGASSTRSRTSTRRTRARSPTRPRRRYQDNHLGDVATATFDREMASTLEDNSTHVLAEIDAALGADRRTGRSASASAAGSRSSRSGSRRYRGRRSASTTSENRNGAEPSRLASRSSGPGSRTDGLAPISVAARSLAAQPVHWLGLAAVAVAAVVADQLTKHVVASQVALDDEVQGDRAVLDPPRPELRDRLRPVRERDGGRDRADPRRRRLDDRLLRALRRPASAAAGRGRPADRRQRLQPRRPRPPRTRHRLPRPPLLARVQPRRQLHRDRRRGPARGARRRRPRRRARRRVPTQLRVPESAAGARLDRFLAELPEVGSRARRRAPARRRRRPGRRRRRGAKSHRLEGGEELELDRARDRRPAAGDASRSISGSPTRTSTSLVVDKPAGPRRAPGRRPRRPARSSRAARRGVAGGEPERPGHRPPPRPRHVRAARRRAHARRRTSGLRALVQAPRARARVPRARPRPARARAAGRIEAPIGRDRRDPTRRSLDTDSPRDAVTHFEVVELLPRPRAAARPPRDRAHAPDPRPPRRDRAAGRRRPGLRRRRSRACAASSCTPRGSRSPTRSPASADRRRRRRFRRSGRRARACPRYACSPFCPTDPADTPGRRCRLAHEPVPPRPAGCTTTQTERGTHRGCRLHARASGGRGPLRPPDPPLEPEDAQVHLHRARRDLHHRPPADRRSCSRRRTSSRRTSPSAAAPCSSSARRSRRRTRSRSRRSASACRTSTTAGSAGC